MGTKEFLMASAAGAIFFTGIKVLAPEFQAELAPDTVAIVRDILQLINDVGPVIAWTGGGVIIGAGLNVMSGEQKNIFHHFKKDTTGRSEKGNSHSITS